MPRLPLPKRPRPGAAEVAGQAVAPPGTRGPQDAPEVIDLRDGSAPDPASAASAEQPEEPAGPGEPAPSGTGEPAGPEHIGTGEPAGPEHIGTGESAGPAASAADASAAAAGHDRDEPAAGPASTDEGALAADDAGPAASRVAPDGAPAPPSRPATRFRQLLRRPTVPPAVARWRVRVEPVRRAVVLDPSLAGRTGPLRSVLAAAAWSVGVPLFAALVVVLLIGATSAGTQIATWDIFLSVWRAMHLMPIRTAAGPVSLVPMAGAVLVVLVGLRSAKWLWRSVEGRTPRPGRALAASAGISFAVTLAIACLPAAGPAAGSPLAGAGALAGLAAGPPLLVVARRTLRRDRPRIWLLLRAAATVLMLLGGAALALVLLSALLSGPQLVAGSTALLTGTTAGSGWPDAVALVALQLAYLPNMVVWAAAYLLGAGFAVGAGTVVSPFTVGVGALPQIPVVALLPEHGLSTALLPMLLVAVLAALSGRVLRHIAADLPIRGRAALAGLVTLVVAAAMTVLAAASGGALGPGRLDPMGPSPWAVALATVVVVGAGLLFWAVLPTLVADVRPHVAAAVRTVAEARRTRRRRKAAAEPS